jgi:predicted permease
MTVSIIRHLTAGIRALVNRPRADRELDDELRHWMELAVDERMRRGLTREEAEREVRLDVGGIGAMKEHARSGGWEAVVETVIRDIRYAARTLRASPAYTLAAIATLGVAITVTTTLLTVSNTVLRQQWAVPDPSRVVTILTARGGPRFSPAEARFLGERAKTFAGIIAVRCLSGMNDDCQLPVDGVPAAIDFVSGKYFDVVGLPLAMGRGFAAGEDEVSNPASVVVISDAMWRARFGSDPRVVGTSMRIDGVRFTIVGVAARDFTGTRTERKEAWLPLASMLLLRPQRPEVRAQLTSASADVSDAVVAGRLAIDATPVEALAELRVLDRQYRQDNRLDDLGVSLMPTTYFPNPSKLRTAAAVFTSMFVAVVLVLMLACANAGNLLLARATARGREIAVRLALGASRARVVSQLLTESLLLSLAAGALGVSASLALPSAIMTRAFGSVSWHFTPDAVVITATTAIVLLTCVAFGLAPSLHATRTDVAVALRTGDAGFGASAGRRLRGALLALQVAVSLLLLVTAGVLSNAIRRGHDSNPGYATRSVGVLTVELPATYEPARTEAFVRQFMSDGRGLTGVRVAFASVAPLGARRMARLRLPGEPETRAHLSDALDVSPGFFGLLGLPIVAGRDLESTDSNDAILVNESLAAMLWPGESPLGQVVNDGIDRRVVGVVKDASMMRLGIVEGALFRPLATRSAPVILTQPVSPATTQAMAAIAARIEPRATIHEDSIAGNVDRQLGGLKVVAALASILGLIALVLASVGVFGVFAYIVEQRTREIGIRVALGASSAAVTALVVRDSARPLLAGLGAGLVLSMGVTRIISSELYGATALDWRLLTGLATLLAVAGAMATLVPVRRATRVDPVVALRTE